MKKTLIASAVAAATLSTSTFAMDNKQAEEIFSRLDSMPEFYGSLELVNKTVDDGDDETSTFEDNGSTFGFKHSHEVSDGLTAFMKVELEYAGDDKDSSSGIDTLDEAYLGLKGDFGSIQFGSDDSVYEDVEHVDISEAVGPAGGLGELSEGDNLQYRSPEIGEGITLGLTLPLDIQGDDAFNAGISANMEMDNITATFAYSAARDGFEDAIGLAGTIGLDDLSVSLQYETQSDVADYFHLLGQYSMGATNLALGYGMFSFDADGSEDETELFLQALHNLSDNMYVYLEYFSRQDVGGVEDVEEDTLALGITYGF